MVRGWRKERHRDLASGTCRIRERHHVVRSLEIRICPDPGFPRCGAGRCGGVHRCHGGSRHGRDSTALGLQRKEIGPSNPAFGTGRGAEGCKKTFHHADDSGVGRCKRAFHTVRGQPTRDRRGESRCRRATAGSAITLGCGKMGDPWGYGSSHTAFFPCFHGFSSHLCRGGQS